MASLAGPPPSNVLYGSRATFTLNGIGIGYATNCAYSHSYSLAPLNVIGSIETIQHLPMMYSATLTFNNFVLIGQSLRTLGFWPKIGTNPTEHIQALAAIPELTAVLEDTVSSTIIAIAQGVRVESSSVQVASGNLMAEDISCTVRRILTAGDAY